MIIMAIFFWPAVCNWVIHLSFGCAMMTALTPLENIDNRWQSVFEKLPIAVLLIDESGVVEKCNQAATDILATQLVGQYWRDIIKTTFAPREDDGHDITLIDGKRVSIATGSLHPHPGQIISITNLTKNRQWQDNYNRTHRLAAMGNMSAQMAHQLRTPISTALLYLHHCKRDDVVEEKKHQFLDKSITALHHIEQLVRDMLIFAKGGNTITANYPINALLTDLGQLFTAEENQQSQQISIQTAQCADSVCCNRDALIGALSNLINNALQAGNEQTRITVTVEQSEQYWIFTVKDNGPGIDSALLEKIRQPFFTTKAKGTGLGLTVVDVVAKAHKGFLAIDSKTNIGTEMKLHLPKHRSLSNAA